jgi:putative transcriptional regulator
MTPPDDETTGPDLDDDATHIRCRLGEVLAERGMTLTELAARTGITVVNLSVLKNNRARAVRFSTLARVCAVLGTTPGDLLVHAPPDPPAPGG